MKFYALAIESKGSIIFLYNDDGLLCAQTLSEISDLRNKQENSESIVVFKCSKEIII